MGNHCLYMSAKVILLLFALTLTIHCKIHIPKIAQPKKAVPMKPMDDEMRALKLASMTTNDRFPGIGDAIDEMKSKTVQVKNASIDKSKRKLHKKFVDQNKKTQAIGVQLGEITMAMREADHILNRRRLLKKCL